jgi:hypothetical protein
MAIANSSLGHLRDYGLCVPKQQLPQRPTSLEFGFEKF